VWARRWLVLSILTLPLLFLPLVPLPAAAEPAAPASSPGTGAGKVVLVVANFLDPWLLLEPTYPQLQRLVRKGALGLVNSKPARKPAEAYAAVGAGAPVPSAPPEAGLGFNTGENYRGTPVNEVYKRHMGSEPGGAAVVHLGLVPFLESEEVRTATFEMAVLGDALHQAGLRTAVVGNADYQGEHGRHAVTIAMDRRGRVDRGEVSAHLLTADPSSPFGLRTDWRKLAAAYRQALSEADFVVVETGDSSRLEGYRKFMRPGVARRQTSLFLERFDGFIGDVWEGMDPNRDLLLIYSPLPPGRKQSEGDTFTPLIMAGGGVVPGVVDSVTTRRPGVATPADLGATIAAFLGVELPPSMVGRPLGSRPTEDPALLLRQVHTRALNNIRVRGPLLKAYVISEIVVLLAATVAVLAKKRLNRSLRPFLLSLTVIPLTFLLVPWVARGNLVTAFTVVIVATVVVTSVLLRAGPGPIDPFLAVSLATGVILILDTSTGARLMMDSPMGYSTIGGARYYGIGNEYMGVLLGATLIGTTGLVDRFTASQKLLKGCAVAVFAVVLYLLASPRLGANLGGILSAAAAYTYVMVRLYYPGRTPSRLWLLPFLVPVAAVASMVALDFFGSDTPRSHVARTVTIVRAEGFGALWAILSRKIALNLKLIRWTIWSRVLLTSLGTFAFLVFRPVGLFQRIIQKYPYLGVGFSGVTVASLTALVVNDSGVVAAATTMIYATATLIYLLLRELERAA